MKLNRIDAMRWLMMATVAMALLGATACANTGVRAETVGQSLVEAYGVLEKANDAITIGLQQGTLSSARARKLGDDVDAAYAKLEGSRVLLELGDTSSVLGKLQAAKLLLDSLTEFLAEGGAR